MTNPRTRVKFLTRITKFLTVLLAFYSLVFIRLASLNVSGVDFNCYANYARSIVDNHDMNMLDKVTPHAAWIVSTTFNYPDMHDHGASVLWAPVFWFGKLLDLGTWQNGEIWETRPYFIPVTMVIAVLISVFAIRLASLWARSALGVELGFREIFPVVFGTGFFFFTLIEFSNADMTALALAVLFLTFSSKIDRSFKVWDYFFLGLLLTFGRVVKLTFPLNFIPMMYFYLGANCSAPPSYHLKALSGFLAGCALILLPMEYNLYLKYGFFFPGQGYPIQYHLDSLWNHDYDLFVSYFGPIGYFLITPTFFITFLGFIYLAARWLFFPMKADRSDRLAVLLYLAVIAKFGLSLFLMTPVDDEWGERSFMMDTTAHFLILAALFRRMDRSKIAERGFLALLLAGVMWAFLNFVWFLCLLSIKPEQLLAHSIRLSGVWARTKLLFSDMSLAIHDLPTSLLINWRYLLFLAPATLVLLNLDRIADAAMKRKLALPVVSLSILGLYLSVTLMNHLNNSQNAALLRGSGKFNNIVVGNGPNIFTFDNVGTDLLPPMDLDRHTRHREAFDRKLKFIRDFLAKVKTEVVSDNIGFVKEIEAGRVPRIGTTNDPSGTEVLDYNGRDRILDTDGWMAEFARNPRR